MKEDINIMFCTNCKWKIINPKDFDKTNRCPKCESWTWEIFENYFYKNNKLIHREFGITDNDEVFLDFYSKADAKRLMTKAFKLFEKEVQE